MRGIFIIYECKGIEKLNLFMFEDFNFQGLMKHTGILVELVLLYVA